MNDFISKFADRLSGSLTGFDRLVFRGTNGLNHSAGMKGYLWAHDVKLKEFGTHAEAVSQRVREAAVAAMVAAGRPVIYLNSGKDKSNKWLWPSRLRTAFARVPSVRSKP